jgi:hypothetical protein
VLCCSIFLHVANSRHPPCLAHCPMTTATPTLPPSWTPSATGCLNTQDLWIWNYSTDLSDQRTVVGGPSQTSVCFPSNFATNGVFSGSSCPPNYTAACQAVESQASVTCCPTYVPNVTLSVVLTRAPLIRLQSLEFRLRRRYGARKTSRITLSMHISVDSWRFCDRHGDKLLGWPNHGGGRA